MKTRKIEPLVEMTDDNLKAKHEAKLAMIERMRNRIVRYDMSGRMHQVKK